MDAMRSTEMFDATYPGRQIESFVARPPRMPDHNPYKYFFYGEFKSFASLDICGHTVGLHIRNPCCCGRSDHFGSWKRKDA
ncbi:hypothetical protein AVEN_184538-1 [Araneus ventricosus]|uniref:Uncharacterized protein n=1 Tax=Araneus ventricosus TaxID=182803 RepID=A0A4Y2JPD9_ARAVE|nr:hypothetical protein AVEN_184538-1 [Araneus ventricosus]